jgi:hypothetical protein
MGRNLLRQTLRRVPIHATGVSLCRIISSVIIRPEIVILFIHMGTIVIIGDHCHHWGPLSSLGTIVIIGNHCHHPSSLASESLRAEGVNRVKAASWASS